MEAGLDKAHQPFGIVAGAKQYKCVRHVMFSGYAGTSASGFAAEVATEEAVARLDYAEDLYHDWNGGGRSQGGASARIHAEFARIRRELGDLPGVVSSPTRLQRMLAHLTKTLYPGILNDCFYQSATAVCRKQAKALGAPCRCTTCACTARTRAAQACTFPGSPWPATRPPRRWTSPPQAAATCRRCSGSPCRPTSPTWTE
jgi:hypothetical protein